MASLGDDHLPVTVGWDERLLAALPEHGGYAYPNDGRRDDVPEAVFVSTSIVAGLGWFCFPGVAPWYFGNIWGDIGAGAGGPLFFPHLVGPHPAPHVTRAPGRP